MTCLYGVTDQLLAAIVAQGDKEKSHLRRPQINLSRSSLWDIDESFEPQQSSGLGSVAVDWQWSGDAELTEALAIVTELVGMRPDV